MPAERNPQKEDKYIVRFPEGMRDRLKEAAKTNNRTLNAEIVTRLEASFSQQPPSINLRASGPVTAYGEDGSVQQISLEDLARALAAEIKQSK